MKNISTLIALLVVVCNPLHAEETTYPKQAVISMLFDPLESTCDEKAITLSKLSKEECDLLRKKTLSECRNIIGSDKDDIVSENDVFYMMGRTIFCTSSKLAGGKYSNEAADEFIKKQREAKESK